MVELHSTTCPSTTVVKISIYKNILNHHIVIKNSSLKSLIEAHKISIKSMLCIKQNLFWAFAYNLVAIPIAVSGLLNPMWGALFMAFSDVIVIGNSIRLRYKRIF